MLGKLSESTGDKWTWTENSFLWLLHNDDFFRLKKYFLWCHEKLFFSLFNLCNCDVHFTLHESPSFEFSVNAQILILCIHTVSFTISTGALIYTFGIFREKYRTSDDEKWFKIKKAKNSIHNNFEMIFKYYWKYFVIFSAGISQSYLLQSPWDIKSNMKTITGMKMMTLSHLNVKYCLIFLMIFSPLVIIIHKWVFPILLLFIALSFLFLSPNLHSVLSSHLFIVFFILLLCPQILIHFTDRKNRHDNESKEWIFIFLSPVIEPFEWVLNGYNKSSNDVNDDDEKIYSFKGLTREKKHLQLYEMRNWKVD